MPLLCSLSLSARLSPACLYCASSEMAGATQHILPRSITSNTNYSSLLLPPPTSSLFPHPSFCPFLPTFLLPHRLPLKPNAKPSPCFRTQPLRFDSFSIPSLAQPRPAGKSSLGKITRFDVSDYTCQIGSEVPDFVAGDFFASAKTAKSNDRFTHLAMGAARMAIDDSGIDLGKVDKTRFGCMVGSAFGGMQTYEDQVMSTSPPIIPPRFSSRKARLLYRDTAVLHECDYTRTFLEECWAGDLMRPPSPLPNPECIKLFLYSSLLVSFSPFITSVNTAHLLSHLTLSYFSHCRTCPWPDTQARQGWPQEGVALHNPCSPRQYCVWHHRHRAR